MSKHTPGPWLVVESGHVRTSSLQLVAVANYSREANANARLIAAAPDLLDALRALLAVAPYHAPGAAQGVMGAEDRHASAIKAARAAIAKAEGKE